MGQEGGSEAGGGRAMKATRLGAGWVCALGPQDRGLLAAEWKTRGHIAQIKSLSFLFSLVSFSQVAPGLSHLPRILSYLCSRRPTLADPYSVLSDLTCSDPH